MKVPFVEEQLEPDRPRGPRGYPLFFKGLVSPLYTVKKRWKKRFSFTVFSEGSEGRVSADRRKKNIFKGQEPTRTAKRANRRLGERYLSPVTQRLLAPGKHAAFVAALLDRFAICEWCEWPWCPRVDKHPVASAHVCAA